MNSKKIKNVNKTKKTHNARRNADRKNQTSTRWGEMRRYNATKQSQTNRNNTTRKNAAKQNNTRKPRKQTPATRPTENETTRQHETITRQIYDGEMPGKSNMTIAQLIQQTYFKYGPDAEK